MNALLPLIVSFALPAAELSPGVPGRGPDRPHDAEFRPGEFVARLIGAVDATPDQAAQLEAIAAETRAALESARQTRREAFAEHRDELRTLQQQLREARRDGDRDKVAQLTEQIRQLVGPPPQEIIGGALDRIKDVLTEEQLETARDLFRPHRRHRHRGEPGAREEAAKESSQGSAITLPGDDDVPGSHGRRAPRGPHGGMHLSGPGGSAIYGLVQHIAAEAEVTDEQRAQLLAIAREHVRAVMDAEAERIIVHEERGEELRGLHERLDAAEESGDESAADSIRAQLREILGPPPHELFDDARERIEAVLTESQRARLPRLFPEG